MLFGALAVAWVVTSVTDKAGHTYIPEMFHVVTFVGLALLAIVIKTRRERQR